MNKQPTKDLSLLQGMPWTPHDQTNVQETWRRHGWTPSKPKPVEPLKKYREQRQ